MWKKKKITHTNQSIINDTKSCVMNAPPNSHYASCLLTLLHDTVHSDIHRKTWLLLNVKLIQNKVYIHKLGMRDLHWRLPPGRSRARPRAAARRWRRGGSCPRRARTAPPPPAPGGSGSPAAAASRPLPSCRRRIVLCTTKCLLNTTSKGYTARHATYRKVSSHHNELDINQSLFNNATPCI